MEKVLFLLPYLIALAITTGVFFYTWRHRQVRGAQAYAWYVAGQALWGLGFIFELISPALGGKIFWDKFQWIAGFFIVIAFPLFTVQYTGHKIKNPGLVWGVTSIVPVVMTAIVLTDSQHHLIYSNPSLMFDSIYPELHYDFTWVVYGYAVYSYLVTFIGLGLLIQRMFRPHRLYIRQILTVALGFFIPIFFTILTTAGVEFAPFRDVSILTFALGNLIIAAGLFRFKLFEIVPIARELVLESIEDLVIVLDMQDRIVDINPTALLILETKASQVIGQPAATVFAQWPELVKRFFEPKNIRSEISIGLYHFEIKSTLLYDKNDRYVGRVFVARDITERKELQKELEELNQELEERVAKRTKDLRKSEERYRAVVEHQSELITRWKPDRTRTFVNEAYCRYFEITQEQAMGVDFMSLIVEEDRPAKQEKISRLEEGLVVNDVDIQRVYRPDGSIGWQEWVDTAIRDENGKIIEFQSVGRDITERKRAEEALRISEDRYRRLAENAPDVIFRYTLSPAPKLEYINPAVERISGYSPEECYADPLLMLNMAHPDDAHLMAELMQSLDPLDEPIIMRWIGKDNVVRWMESRIVPIYDEEKQIVAIEGLTRDITERKQAEVAQRESEEKFRNLFENMNDGFAFHKIILNEDGKPADYQFIDVNPVFAQRVGMKPEDLINHTALELFPNTEQEWIDTFGQVALTGKPMQFSHYSIELDRYYDVRLYCPRPGYFAGVFSDITERKQAEKQLAEAYDTTLVGWAKALELRDKETEDHSRRVTKLTVILAKAMGIDENELTHIRRGAILHDIGKMGIPDEILRKPGKLTDYEMDIIRQHPVHSYKLLSSIPFLHKALDIPYCHHERWDGSGYPRGLKEEEIPLAARIFSVVDVWDAVLSDRPYNHAWNREEAIDLISSEAGKHFDPKIVDIFLHLVKSGEI